MDTWNWGLKITSKIGELCFWNNSFVISRSRPLIRMNPDIKLAAKAVKRSKENLQNYKLSRYGSLSLSSSVISRVLQEANQESKIEKLEQGLRTSKSCANVPNLKWQSGDTMRSSGFSEGAIRKVVKVTGENTKSVRFSELQDQTVNDVRPSMAMMLQNLAHE